MQNFRAKPDTKMRGVPDAEPGRPGRDHRGGPAGARPGRADPGAAEPDRRPVPADPGRGDRRLGRGVAADPGSRQPGTALAADRRPRRPHRGRRVRPARAADHLSRLHPRAVAGPAAGGARRAPWPTRPPGWPARARCPAACPGRSQTAAGATPAAGPTCTSPSTPPAGPRTAGTTSPRSTGTGPRSAPGSSRPPGGPRPPGRRRGCAPRCSRRCARAENDPGRALRRPGARAARRRRPRA